MNISRLLAQSSDIEVCAGMMSSSSPWKDLYFSYSQCNALLNSPGIEVHGAIEAGELIGFVASLAQNFGGEPMIEYVCVREDQRSKGIGSVLIGFFEDELFPNSDNLYMFVSDINPRALALYERLGYRVVGELPDYNLPGQTEFLIRKTRRPRQLKFKP